jgi:hypothetical protein
VQSSLASDFSQDGFELRSYRLHRLLENNDLLIAELNISSDIKNWLYGAFPRWNDILESISDTLPIIKADMQKLLFSQNLLRRYFNYVVHLLEYYQNEYKINIDLSNLSINTVLAREELLIAAKQLIDEISSPRNHTLRTIESNIIDEFHRRICAVDEKLADIEKLLPNHWKKIELLSNVFIFDTNMLEHLYQLLSFAWSRNDGRLDILALNKDNSELSIDEFYLQRSEGSFIWAKVSAAYKYQLVSSPTGHIWNVLYEGEENRYGFELSSGEWFFKVRSKIDDLFADWSTILNINNSITYNSIVNNGKRKIVI